MTNGKPNVLLLIPNLGSGGAQRVFHQHREFLAGDFNVTACVFNFDGAFDDERNENILSLDVPAGKNLIEKATNFFKRVSRLKEIKNEHDIDVTISHLEGADYVNILSRQKDKLVLWIHGTKLHDREISGVLGWFRKRIMLPFLYRRADKIACVSRGIAAELEAMVPVAAQKIVTVENGIDIADVQARSSEPLPAEWQSLMNKHFVIVTHCRFAPQKNLRPLLHVIAALKDVHDVRFVLLGDGEQREQLIELSERLSIPTYKSWTNDSWSEDYRLFFPGRQSNPFPWLRHSSLYVLSSLWEGFPLSMCEAIACGLPIVASDCPTGPKEILESVPAGVLMPQIFEDLQLSIDKWTQKLREVVNDKLLLGVWRKRVVEGAPFFSWDRTKAETIKVVKSVIA